MSAGVRALPYQNNALSLVLAIVLGAVIYASAIVLFFPEIRMPLMRRLRRFVEAPAL